MFMTKNKIKIQLTKLILTNATTMTADERITYVLNDENIDSHVKSIRQYMKQYKMKFDDAIQCEIKSAF